MSSPGRAPVVLAPNLPETFYAGSGRLARFRGVDVPDRPEEWIASTTCRFGHDDSGLSVLPDGTTLREAIRADPRGWLGRDDPDPGLLVKLLDTGQRLPLHVHPDRDFARSHLASPYGKTEAWIVLDAAPDAVVNLGFNRPVEAAELDRWVREQDVAAMLAATNAVPIRAGDAVLCPAGTPHAIGAGVLLIELQEPTDFSIMLETEGFPIPPQDALLGLSRQAALSCVTRSAALAGAVTAMGDCRAGRIAAGPGRPVLPGVVGRRRRPGARLRRPRRHRRRGHADRRVGHDRARPGRRAGAAARGRARPADGRDGRGLRAGSAVVGVVVLGDVQLLLDHVRLVGLVGQRPIELVDHVGLALAQVLGVGGHGVLGIGRHTCEVRAAWIAATSGAPSSARQISRSGR